MSSKVSSTCAAVVLKETKGIFDWASYVLTELDQTVCFDSKQQDVIQKWCPFSFLLIETIWLGRK